MDNRTEQQNHTFAGAVYCNFPVGMNKPSQAEWDKCVCKRMWRRLLWCRPYYRYIVLYILGIQYTLFGFSFSRNEEEKVTSDTLYVIDL